MAPRYLNLKIDGQVVKDVILQHVSVTQGLNDHWWCHAECRHTQDQRTSSSPPSAAEDADSEKSAITVEEWLGKDLQVIEVDDGEAPLFHGFVLEVELLYELSGSFTAILQGVTQSFKMDLFSGLSAGADTAAAKAMSVAAAAITNDVIKMRINTAPFHSRLLEVLATDAFPTCFQERSAMATNKTASLGARNVFVLVGGLPGFDVAGDSNNRGRGCWIASVASQK